MTPARTISLKLSLERRDDGLHNKAFSGCYLLRLSDGERLEHFALGGDLETILNDLPAICRGFLSGVEPKPVAAV